MGHSRRTKVSSNRVTGKTIGGIGLAASIVALLVTAFVVGGSSGDSGASNDAAPPAGNAGKPRITLPSNAKVLIFGDSYTQGWGATPQNEAWAFHMDERMGWQVTVDGVGGTGFLNPGSGAGKGTYAQRIKKLNAPGPFDLIILQGGSNDQKLQVDDAGRVLDPQLITDAIGEAYTQIEEKYPNTPVVMLGPASVATTTNQQKKLMDSLMLQFADTHNLWYISPVRQGWFKTQEQATLVDMATGHPNNLGYVRIADKVQEDLNERILANPQAPAPTPQGPPIASSDG